MPDINDLRRARAKTLEQVQALAVLEQQGDELNSEQLIEFNELQADFSKLDAKIKRAESAEQMAAAAAQEIPGLKSTQEKVFATPKQPDIKGAKVARMVQAIGAVGGAGREAAHYAENTLGDAEVAAALNTTEGTAGGALIPQAFLGDLIELLTPQSVVRSMGVTTLPMPNGNLTIPKMTGGATSSYLSEGSDIQASQQTFGDLQLSAKNLATLVPVSNQLLNYNGINSRLEQVLIGDMTNSMALREDLAFIRGDGSNNTPKGMRNLALAANIITAPADTSVQGIKNALGQMEVQLLNANVRMLQPGWILNPTIYTFLYNLVDGNGNSVFPEMKDGTLRGKPFKATTQVPSNLGAGTESELYLVDFVDLILAESDDVSIAVSQEATYKDPTSGDLISAFTRNQTLIRVISAHDFGARYEESIVVMTGIKWGQ